MKVNLNTTKTTPNFGMAIKFDKKASEYLQKNASKKTLTKLAKIMESEKNNKSDILLSRKEILEFDGSYWKATSLDNKNLTATAEYFCAPVRALKKLIKLRDAETAKIIESIKNATVK